ncbi:MAG: lipoyltransferase [Alloprevotella sp.]|nr:lipoyltransferase [Alloprevotella sp.]MBR1652263.1 lipoyltransferase [Alloprevotella sp.]
MSTTQTHDKSDIFPACYVDFPADVEGRSAAFFLAAEEFMAREMPEDNYVFFWQLRPTCVYGRNQDPANELDLDFCRQHGIELVRRKSGGGTIFANRDNIMTSLVTGGGAVEPVFDAFAQSVAGGLRRLGAPTKVSGRNDICFEDGRKICGNAFYHLPRRNIVHCTMLYDTDMELMTGSLTPPAAKLQSKGVRSVRSRIGLLKEYLDFGVDELRRQLRLILTDRSLRLTEAQLRRIEELERPYHDPAYLFGTAEMKETAGRRIEGCGRVDFHVRLHEGRIESVALTGDYFETGSQSATTAFTEALKGLAFDSEAVAAALAEHRPERTVRGLQAGDVMGILFGTNE